MRKCFCILILLLLFKPLQAQLSGIYSVPVTFTSLAAAINSLNSVGVTGPVTIAIAAGYTETIPAGGYTLYALAGASATSQVTFQKSGPGSNPLLYAYAGGTNYPYSTAQDGMFWLLGADYITIDQINLLDPNTSNPATMEVGYGLFKASGNDGCQHNTIRNCVVTLQRMNGFSTNIYGVEGCRGIELANSLTTTYNNPSAPAVNVFSGTNSYNSIYSNTIQSCHTGISVCGTISAVSHTIADTDNLVGGTSPGSGNTIINFGGGGTGNAAGIATAYQTGLTVTGNYVNNNTGLGANGAADLRGLYIQDCDGVNTAVVTNNTITLAGGGVNFNHFGINVSFGTSFSNTSIVTVLNNLITNCTYTNTTYGPFKGIGYTGVGGTLSAVSNTISNLTISGSGTITLIQPSGNGTVSSNVISGVTFSGAGVLQGIAGKQVSNNLVEGLGLTALTSTGAIIGCYGGGTVTQNVFRNYYAAAQATVCGVSEVSGGTVTVSGNSIYNFTTTSGGAGSNTLSGISLNSGGSVISNTISALNAAGTNTNAANLTQGIAIYGGTTYIIGQNKIYDLSASGSAGQVNGIGSTTSIPTGSFPTSYIINNLIGDLRAPSSNGSNQVVGINTIRTSTNYVYYNSIYINASSSSALFGSSAITCTTAASLDLRNNILVNLSSPSGSGKTIVYRRTTPTFSTHAAASNNNLLYAGTPSASRQIFSDGTTNCQALADYKFYAMYADNNSVTELPSFLSISGASANFLNIDTSLPTQIESGGLAVSTTTTDFTGNVRNATTPDIGAWEGNYIFTDLLPPSLYNSGFTSTNSCNPSARTLTLTLGDVNGVATGSLSPRLYYRVNGGTYSSLAGTLSAGTNTFGTWTFSMTYASVPTDIVHYFVLAQDQSPAQNMMSWPPTGFLGASVNSVTTPPSSPLSYSVMYNLAGTYSVGAGGTFTSLTQAVAAYNYGCLAGPVHYVLTNISYNAAQETFPVLFLNNTDASPTNSLLITPQTGSYVSISSGTTSYSTLKFMGARYITLDGVNSPSTGLSISQPTSGYLWYPTVIWLASQGTVTGNSNLTFRQLSIYSLYIGINSCRHDSLSMLGGVNNNNITIDGNLFYKGAYSILGLGTGPYLPYPGTISNWTIKNNYIGGAGSLSVGVTGTYANYMNNLSFTGNVVSNIAQTGLQTNVVTGADISHNLFTNINNPSQYANGTAAIVLGESVNSVTVSHNVIDGVSSLLAGEAWGIAVIQTYSTATTNYISNNMISNIRSLPYSNGGYGPRGILVASGGSLEIDNNTINLTGTISTGFTGMTGINSAAIEINNAFYGAAYKIRNNILVNTLYFSNVSGQTTYALYCQSNNSVVAVNTQIVATDRNDYYSNMFAWNQGLNINTMAGMQTTFGGNLNSVSLNPVFASANDLHLPAVAGNLPLNDLGSPLPGIIDDIDGQSRSATTPDIGADEFSVPICLSAGAGTISVPQVTACSGSIFVLSSSGANLGVNAGFTWKVSSTSGSGYVTAGSSAGTLNPSYTAGSPAGTYYYILSATCGTSSAVVSNEATVTINTTPSVIVTANTVTVCTGQNLTLTASSLNGTNYSWTGPANHSANTQTDVLSNVTASASGVYSVVTSAGNCTSTAANVSVTVVQAPSSLSVTPSSTLICSNAAAQLAVNGGQFGTSSGPYLWTPATGLSPVSGSLVSAMPGSSTIYTVSVNNSGCIKSQTVAVSVTALPALSIASSASAVCTGASATLTASGAASYTWNTASVLANIVVSPALNTIYTVSSQVLPCPVVTSALSLPVYTLPAVSIAASSGTICSGQTYTLAASGAASYSWSTGSASGQVTIAPVAPMSYSLLGLSSQGCQGSATLAIAPAPTPTVTIAQSSQSVCAGSPVTFTATGAALYTWNNSVTSSTVTYSPSANTVYAVTGQDAVTGCTASALANITVQQLPVITISPSSDSVCPGNTATLTAGGALSYTWASPPGSGSSVTVSPVLSTAYSVSGSDNGCISGKTITVGIFVPQPPAVTPAGQTLCTGEVVSLMASGAASYTWMPGNLQGSTYTAVVQSGETYTLHATDVNGCFTATTISVSVDPCTGLSYNSAPGSEIRVYPTPFNDILHVSIDDISGTYRTLQIYSLRGEIVYEELINKKDILLPLHHLANGLYLLRTGSFTIKIVKE